MSKFFWVINNIPGSFFWGIICASALFAAIMMMTIAFICTGPTFDIIYSAFIPMGV